MPRPIPEKIAGDLLRGVTKLSRCYIVTRKDGRVFGFTDHDNPLLVNGVLCEPNSGFVGSSIDSTLGAATDGSDISGWLKSDAITARDLDFGLWNSASVLILYADWSSPTNFVILAKQEFSEVTRIGSIFSVELRSQLLNMNIRRGFTLAGGCNKILGDARCTVDLETYRQTMTVTAAGENWIEADDIAATVDELYFIFGEVTLSSGEKIDIFSQDDNRITLWQSIYSDIAVGDTFTITSGCDQTFAVCRARFNNADRYGGQPHMVGTDVQASTGTNPAQEGGVSHFANEPPDAPVVTGTSNTSPLIITFERVPFTVKTIDGRTSVYGLDGAIGINGVSWDSSGVITLVATHGGQISDPTVVPYNIGPNPDPPDGGR